MKILEILKNLTAIQRNIAIVVIAAVLLGTVGTVTVVKVVNRQEPKSHQETEPEPIVIEIPDEEDPQSIVMEEQKEDGGAEVDFEQLSEWTPPSEVTMGIDVSKYQGKIDWKKVAGAGIDFAMIRVGHRTLVDGKLVADDTAEYNMQQATKHGIKIGVYFFSTAVNEVEAKEEAEFVAGIIRTHRITYPVAYDCEGFEKKGNRQYGMSIEQRTSLAITFMETIAGYGYSPMFYGSKSDMQDELQWDMELISSYNIWVAQYPGTPYPETKTSTFGSPHVMWQYTSKGRVPGINGNVDMNVAYFGFTEVAPPKEEGGDEDVQLHPEATMKFEEVEEQVTAKEKVNLRSIPSQGTDSVIKYTLLNGETATRTGISPSGWSRIVYQGEVCYAVTSYLTTDLGYKPPTEEKDEDGIKTVFQEVNVQVTPKDAVNLRKKPSVDDAIAPVVVKISNGEVVTKTGVSENGWARVVYQGQTLYCIDSYLKVAE